VNPPRVAFFADSFLEVNGVAHTCRTLSGLAGAHGHPFFVVHGGPETQFIQEGSVTRCQLRRGPASFSVDRDFRYDLLFYRHRAEIERRLRAFAPDLIHITGPGDAGTLGLIMARKLGLPLCASWHTNLHEYAGRRLEKVTPFLPPGLRNGLGTAAEGGSMQALAYFYKVADTVMAPNQELLDLLAEYGTGPGYLMSRGVDTGLFTPARRRRVDNSILIGFVGRLNVEKNIHFLARIDASVDARFLVVGEGTEKEWLAKNLRQVDLPGVLRGEELAEAYANMDIFVFPSHTDTFGNAVLEALASGVPAVVTNGGGPKFIIRNGESGLVAASDADFVECVSALARDEALRRRMSLAARRQAMESSWESVWLQMLRAWNATRMRRRQIPA
jgi:glycosyltransferase involved in cell wall biosynthesis